MRFTDEIDKILTSEAIDEGIAFQEMERRIQRFHDAILPSEIGIFEKYEKNLPYIINGFNKLSHLLRGMMEINILQRE
ncbi:MAG: hypothetical protein AB1403_19835, partial [Candidatus Riflebacteria bacterium]